MPVPIDGAHLTRIARRPFLRRAGLLGLTLLGGPTTLAACGGGVSTAPPQAAQATTPRASAASAATPAGPATGVRMACWSQPLSEQANIYAAQEFGWFTEQRLDFTFVPGAGGGDAIKNLLAGNADIAFANLEPLLFAIQEGAKLRAVYNIYPQNVFNVVSLTKTGVGAIADLKGKRVGVYSQASGTRYNLLVMLRSAGLKESDVEVVATGVANFGPLGEGKVAATAATDTGLYGARQAGLGAVNVRWARDVLNTPSDIFVVTEETYQRRRDLLARFLQAYRRGSRWMLDSPDQAAEVAAKYATDGKDIARNRAIIELRNASTVSVDTTANGLGHFDLDLLRTVDATFQELGITRQRFDIAAIFTNEFLAEL